MRRRGVVLAELLVTAVIIGVAAAPLLLGLNNSYGMAKYTAHRARALSLVTAKLESLRAMAAANTLTVGDDTTTTAMDEMGTVSTRAVVTQPRTHKMVIDVTVSWSETRNNRTFTESIRIGTASLTGY